jgi:hypothetical protein
VRGKGTVEARRLIEELERLDALLNMPNSFLEANKEKYPELETPAAETDAASTFNQFSTDNPQSDRAQIAAEKHRDDEDDER